jgi:glycosyltransferase involved in cell wall biosynthesis
MNKLHAHRASIPPVSDGTPRPRWSVMIPTYNCADYLRETLNSVLAQDLGPELMQIEVVDDHSTIDDPKAVVRELAGDRVSFYQQAQNVGYIQNFDTCLARSRGQFVHLLHGDDSVRDGFYRKMQQSFDSSPGVGAAFCRQISMDESSHWQWLSTLEQPESGVIDNWLEKIAVINRLQPPSMVVRRSVYEVLGGFDRRIVCCAEDWEMWVRIAASYPVWYEIEPLALYRVHSRSLTGRCACTGQNVRDLRRIVEIIEPYLPAQLASSLSEESRQLWAVYSVKYIAAQMLARGNLTAATTQIREALNCSASFNVIQELVLMLWRTGKISIKNKLNPQ